MTNVHELKRKNKMIKMTWGQIRDPEFNQVMRRLASTQMLYKSARHLQKITSGIESEQKEADKMFLTLQEKYMEPAAAPGFFQIKESLDESAKIEAKQALDEFLETPVEINVAPLDENEIPLAQFSVFELTKLDGLFDVES